MFSSPYRGAALPHKRYAASLGRALKEAGIEGYLRPFHDGRHSAITNAVRAGRHQSALMTLAGHSDSRTTQMYTHLAGTMFQEEAARMNTSLWGEAVEKPGRNSEAVELEDAA